MMLPSTPSPQPLISGRVLQLAFVACAVFLAFTITEHIWNTSRSDAFGTTTEELESMAAAGGWKNQLGFTTLAGLGVLLVVMPGGSNFQPLGPLGFLFAANLAWSVASVAWSIDHGLTLRRLGVLAFCTLGALGVTRRLSLRDLAVVTAWCLGLWILMGLVAEMSLGTFRPWSDEYRFSGTMHPNAQGGNCAGLCLAVWFLNRDQRRPGQKLLLWAVLVTTFVLLILTKSRTSCVGLLIGIGIIECWNVRVSTKLVAGYIAATTAATLLTIALFLPADATGGIADILLLGRNEHLSNLNGRTELWSLLLEYIARRPFLGYGYRSFWVPKNINDISNELFWGISSAHSIYLETILSVGLIGFVLWIVWTVSVGMHALSVRKRTGGMGVAYLLAMLVYASIDGMLESSFVAPSFLTWVAGCGLVRLSLYPEHVPRLMPMVRSEWQSSTSITNLSPVMAAEAR